MNRYYPHTIIAQEGWSFIIGGLVLSILLTCLCGWWSLPFWAFTLFSVNFFRDPARNIPEAPDAILSPADGRIVVVERATDPYRQTEALKISVFMNVFNVHSQRSPVSGTVTDVQYTAGKFLNASLDKSSTENERNAVLMTTKTGRELTFVQVAGLVARRVLCYVNKGDSMLRGERYGFIRFGSRVDVYLPLDATANVAIGDKVRASETILAYLPLKPSEHLDKNQHLSSKALAESRLKADMQSHHQEPIVHQIAAGVPMTEEARLAAETAKLKAETEAARQAAEQARAQAEAEIAQLKAQAEQARAEIEQAKAQAEAEMARLKAQQAAEQAKAEQAAQAARVQAEQEAAAKAKAEQEAAQAARMQAEQEAAAKAKAEQEAQAARVKAEQEAAQAARMQAEQEAAAKAKAEQEAQAARVKAEQEAQAKAEQVARMKAEAEAARVKAEQVARAQAEAKAKEEALAKAKAEADAKLKAEAAAKAKAAAEAKAKAQAEADAKAKAEAEALAEIAARPPIVRREVFAAVPEPWQTIEPREVIIRTEVKK